MRCAVAFIALTLLASAALAQDRNGVNASTFNSLSAADAARMNYAVQNDPKAALDQVEKRLNEGGHRSGQLLEKTRP
jgi:hypothetical protein